MKRLLALLSVFLALPLVAQACDHPFAFVVTPPTPTLTFVLPVQAHHCNSAAFVEVRQVRQFNHGRQFNLNLIQNRQRVERFQQTTTTTTRTKSVIRRR